MVLKPVSKWMPIEYRRVADCLVQILNCYMPGSVHVFIFLCSIPAHVSLCLLSTLFLQVFAVKRRAKDPNDDPRAHFILQACRFQVRFEFFRKVKRNRVSMFRERSHMHAPPPFEYRSLMLNIKGDFVQKIHSDKDQVKNAERSCASLCARSCNLGGSPIS